MMRRPSLQSFATCLALAALSAGAHAGERCPEWGSLVETAIPVTEVTLDRSLTTAQITEIAEKQRPGKAQGLASSTFGFMVSMLTTPSSKKCPRPELLVRIFPDPLKINIASEVVPDSCWDKVLLEHEYRHIFANFRVLEALAPALKHHVVAALEKAEPTSAMAAAEVARGATSAFMHRFVKEVSLENEKIDSGLEAHWLHTACMPGIKSKIQFLVPPPPLIRAPVGYAEVAADVPEKAAQQEKETPPASLKE